MVKLVAAIQSEEGVVIARAIQSGKQVISSLIDQASDLAIARSRQLLVNLSQYQFENRDSRPVIELLLNALDTEDRYIFRTGDKIEKKIF